MAAHETKGEVKEVLGAVTGDRRVEAEGRVEQQADDLTDEAVAKEQQEVQRDHHDRADSSPEREGPLGT
ncbi:MAG TPA: CsbD family protein [Acidimicrobiales bacterium]|jgi:uncharacterized protein YjbJ (UPF0337 family)|nr:CsbD family protein [Acidimicrobiales bacterium]